MPGNSVTLLENGDELFPRIIGAIRDARYEIFIETFIIFDDEVGQEIRAELIRAARRGVWIAMTVDGYGSYYLPDDFILGMTTAGINFRIFDPQPKWFSRRTNVFRRLHRKIVVVDSELAFIGGINFSRIHLIDSGPDAAQDYAVELQGPIVGSIRKFAKDCFLTGNRDKSVDESWRVARDRIRSERRRRRQGRLQQFRQRMHNTTDEADGRSRVLLVTRDNQIHRTDIEDEYLRAIRAAKSEIMIANAYFFPGYRLLREIRNAARRGVNVRLILQGQPDMPIAQKGARMLYDYLVRSGVRIYEYCERPLHGKVAAVDDLWTTVGSSNLDPLSLSLNLEANVMILDRDFNRLLRRRLEQLFDQCTEIDRSWLPPRTPWRIFTGFLVFHFLRHFPAWVGWLPAHTPKLRPAALDDNARLDIEGGIHSHPHT